MFALLDMEKISNWQICGTKVLWRHSSVSFHITDTFEQVVVLLRYTLYTNSWLFIYIEGWYSKKVTTRAPNRDHGLLSWTRQNNALRRGFWSTWLTVDAIQKNPARIFCYKISLIFARQHYQKQFVAISTRRFSQGVIKTRDVLYQNAFYI